MAEQGLAEGREGKLQAAEAGMGGLGIGIGMLSRHGEMGSEKPRYGWN